MSETKPGDGRAPVIEAARDAEIARLGGKRTFAEARAVGACVLCGKTPIGPFADALSEREAQISQLCQGCQDKAFADPEDEPDDADEARWKTAQDEAAAELRGKR